MKRVTVAILSLLVMAGLMVVLQAPNASATTTLNIGDDNIAVPSDNGYPATGYTILATITSPFSTGSFAGTVTTKVVQESTGTLDFFYQIAYTSGGGAELISRATTTDFLQFTTAVAYLTTGTSDFPAGTIAPITADRTSQATVGFDFSGLSNGKTTDWFYIVTNAHNYTTGYVNIIDGNIARVASYAPVPVPASALLLGTGLLGLVGLGYRSRRKS